MYLALIGIIPYQNLNVYRRIAVKILSGFYIYLLFTATTLGIDFWQFFKCEVNEKFVK